MLPSPVGASGHTLPRPAADLDFKMCVESYLQTIDEHIEDRVQLPSWRSIPQDSKFLTSLVDLANQKYPGLNLHTVMAGEAEFGEKLRQLRDQGLNAFRLIFQPADSTKHTIAFDVRCLDGKTSIIGLESAISACFSTALVAIQCSSSTERWLPEAVLTVLETDLQRSHGDCLMFSLALSKKMHSCQQEMTELHQQNLQGQLPVTGSGSIYQHLPAEFMKHAHSSKRLQDYCTHHPEQAGRPVNKMGMGLQERQQQYHGPLQIEDERVISCSNSIEHKRRKEIAALLASPRF